MIIDSNSIETARGSKEGFIVMAEGEGIKESIGCTIKSREGVLDFLNSFKNNQKDLEQFMPDSDYTKVTRLYID